LIAGCTLIAGTLIASRHPLCPEAVAVAFLGWACFAAWRPGLWLLLIPAGLPLFDLGPWSGWIGVDEFDLLVLGAIAGGHARMATEPAARGEARRPDSRLIARAPALFVLASLIALGRGLVDAGGFRFDWYSSYVDPLNTVRVFKPLLLTILLVPMMRAEIRKSPRRAMNRVGVGMCLGLGIVTLAVLWERIAYPGLVDFSKPYRAVALFWEMHVGGAAIDAYLAMATPFAVWALRSARTPVRWSCAALLALLAGYACLTTFSRGVYLAVSVPLVMLAVLERVDLPGWRRLAGFALIAALVAEIAAVVWTGSFLLERMAQSDRDLGGRIAHWRNGLRLFEGWSDGVFGIGLGRSPAHLTQTIAGYEFPGAVRLAADGTRSRGVVVQAAATRQQIEGLYALTQRVPLWDASTYRVDFDHVSSTKVSVWLGVCELHLLYERTCQNAYADLQPGDGTWQHRSVILKGPGLDSGHWFAPRMAVFELALIGTGTRAEFANLELHAGTSPNLLRNGNFAQKLAHWFPSAQSYFVPWHLDSLYVEILVERGALGLAGFVVLVAVTLWRLLDRRCRRHELAPFLAAALGGALLVGLLSSVLDQSRTAFLLYWILAFSLLLCECPFRIGADDRNREGRN
jgi:O-Antigen ligase